MGRASTLKCAFTAFNDDEPNKVFTRLKRIAGDHQFMGINDDMGEVALREDTMISFFTDLWPKAAPWENATAVDLITSSSK